VSNNNVDIDILVHCIWVDNRWQ